MNESELRAKYAQAYRIIKRERAMRAHVFRDDPVKLNAKLVEVDILLQIITEFKDALKEHIGPGQEQMALIEPLPTGQAKRYE
jgi:hypothetical protein